MKKRRWLWIAGAVTLVLGLVAAVLLTSLNKAAEYETYKIKPTEVVKTVSANGQLAETQLLAYGPSQEPVLVSANGSVSIPVQFGISLEIESIEVKVGDSVKAGDLLFKYLNQVGQRIEVVAISDGLVRSIDTAPGLRTSSSVVTVGSAKPIVSIFVSEYDADLVTLKQKVSIELDAINAVFEGEVSRIGQVAQSLSGIKQYEVLVKVKNIPTGARFGMSATAEIEVDKKLNVLAVPMSALIGDIPEVEILKDDSAGNQSVERVEVKLGLVGDSLVEITSGLTSGDEVIIGVSGKVPDPVNFGPPAGTGNRG